MRSSFPDEFFAADKGRYLSWDGGEVFGLWIILGSITPSQTFFLVW
jgi:hypothetical protein